MAASRGLDSNQVRQLLNNCDHGRMVGIGHAWCIMKGRDYAGVPRDKTPDSAIVWDDGYGLNSITTQMADLIANLMSHLATTGGTPTVGGIWTVAPYVGLCTVTPTVASTLGSITEASGNGYNRYQPTWAYVAGPPAGYNNTASPAVFTASGGNLGGGALTSLIVTPASSGTGSAPNTYLMAFMALNGGNQTVANGNTLNVTYSWTVT